MLPAVITQHTKRKCIMNTPDRIWSRFPRTAAFLLATLFMAGTALAIDQPPRKPKQRRAWLIRHIITDMEALGTFDGNSLAKVPGIINALTVDQAALLAQYYFLTRSKTEQDARLYAMQQQGYSDEEVDAAKEHIADLLTVMNDQIVACYNQFASMPPPVQYVAQICYASVPGWCNRAQRYVPEWYYDNGCFVGPCFDAACAGDWAVLVCNAYYDQNSHFNATYHNVAKNVHIKRSTRMANRHADWLRHHGDWHNTLAHDRLVHGIQNGKDSLATRLSVSNNTPVAHARANRTVTGNRNPVVHNQKSRSHSNRVRAQHLAKVHKRATKAHISRHPHWRAHASRPRAHAARLKLAFHAPHSRPAAHTQAHAAHHNQQKHR